MVTQQVVLAPGAIDCPLVDQRIAGILRSLVVTDLVRPCGGVNRGTAGALYVPIHAQVAVVSNSPEHVRGIQEARCEPVSPAPPMPTIGRADRRLIVLPAGAEAGSVRLYVNLLTGRWDDHDPGRLRSEGSQRRHR